MSPYRKRVIAVGIAALAVIAVVLIAGKIVENRLVLTGLFRQTKPNERIDTDGTGQKVATRAYEGEVLFWDPGRGQLQLKVEGNTREVLIAPPKSMLFLATSGAGETQGNMTLVKSKDDPLWEKAYCPGDKATVTLPQSGGSARRAVHSRSASSQSAAGGQSRAGTSPRRTAPSPTENSPDRNP